MPERFGGANYRYSFQGQEADNEVKGKGNSVNYKYRMHDARLGRFFAIDPLVANFPWNSSYAFSENRVIDSKELEGLERFKISDRTTSLYNPETKQVENIQLKILTLEDASAHFEVIDENGVSMQNFKYCQFQCKMNKGYRKELQIPGGEGMHRLKTEEPIQGTKYHTPSTFQLTTSDLSQVSFVASKVFSQTYFTGAADDISDDNGNSPGMQISGIGYDLPEGERLNAGYELNNYLENNFSTIRILNNTVDWDEDSILENLKEFGINTDNFEIIYEVDKNIGTYDLIIEFGNMECDDCE